MLARKISAPSAKHRLRRPPKKDISETKQENYYG